MINKFLDFLFENNSEMVVEYKEKVQELSGFLIRLDGKILLVKPKKFKGMKHKWSIPKGRVEDGKKFKSALVELEQESGIVLNPDVKDRIEKEKIYYKKSGKLKQLTVYVFNATQDDLNIDINNKWEVSKEHFNRKEIYKAKFFDKKDVINKIEMGQMPLLKIM